MIQERDLQLGSAPGFLDCFHYCTEVSITKAICFCLQKHTPMSEDILRPEET